MRKLSALRVARGHRRSQDVATAVSMSLSRYSYVENMKLAIPKEEADRVASEFGLRLEDLFLPATFRVKEVPLDSVGRPLASGE